MLLANEAVGGLLARARRPALYRVHDHPQHEALLALADRLTALGLPVAPLPERADGPEASRAVSRQAELLEPIMRERPATREAFGTLLLRTLQVARYDTGQHRPRRAGLAGLRALHVADPALSRHRRAPRGLRARRASARTRRRPATCPRSPCAARSANARRPTPSAAPMPSAWPSCCATGCAATAGSRRSTASSPASSAPGCSCASATSSRASCRPGGSIPASASTSTSTASRSSGAPRGAASASATSSPAS